MNQGSALRGEAVFFPQHLSPDVHDQLIHNAVLQDRSKFAISKFERAIVSIVLDSDTDHGSLRLSPTSWMASAASCQSFWISHIELPSRNICGRTRTSSAVRSEERRVGKECRSRW